MSVRSLPTLFTTSTTASVGDRTACQTTSSNSCTHYLGEAIDLKMFFHSGWSS